MAAIFALTLRQLAGSRRLWLVLALVSLPVLGAVLFRVGGQHDHDAPASPTTPRRCSAPGSCRSSSLLLATSAFGNEV